MKALLWSPAGGRRCVGRPTLRWSSAFDSSLSGVEGMGDVDWVLCAQSVQDWDEYEDAFCYADSAFEVF